MPSLSTASSIIGFISFSFTISIFLRTFWEAFETVYSAPSQVKDSLTNLRYELYEEQDYVRKVRKMRHSDLRREGLRMNKSYAPGESLRAISDSVREMFREFKHLEAPFLAEAPGDARHMGPHYYYRCDLAHRIIWLSTRGHINTLSQRLEHLQTRRIAHELTETRV